MLQLTYVKEVVMSINYAILGLLEWKPMTGYDLKKVIQDLPFMYWSGNNNQIYKALVQLSDVDAVTNIVQHQDSLPSKKIYSITDTGRTMLNEWLLSSEQEAPEFKKMFLIQLAWAGRMPVEDIEVLLSKYEEVVSVHMIMKQEQKRRGKFFPNRTPREIYLWEMICDNMISSYQSEIDWIKKVKEGLKNIGGL